MAKSISRRLADSASPTGAIDGTLSTAAQTNITSVGTLSALAVSGTSTLTGNVGIGTTSPNSYSGYTALTLNHATNGGLLDFELNGNLQGELYANSANLGLGLQAVGNRSIEFKTNGSIRATIDGSGNFGIGTGLTSPQSKLHVVDETDISASSAGAGQFQVVGNGYRTSIAMDATRSHIYHNSTTRNLSFGTDESVDMTIKGSTGNVGIGTENPSHKLHIFGGAAGPVFTVETASGQYTYQGSDGTGAYIEQVATTAATRKFRLQSSDGSGNYTQLVIDGANRRIEVIPGLDVHDVGTVYTGAGTGKGTIHLDPAIATNFAGNAITFGASDTGGGQSAQAGIYTRTDGSLGTEMHLSTTDSYAAGSKTGIKISNLGNVTVPRGYMSAKQPAAIVRGQGTFLSPAGTGWNEFDSIVNFTAYSQSSDSPWSDTTGRFTAPIAGYYLCTCSAYVQNTSGQTHAGQYIHPQWARNGSVTIAGITPYQIFGHNEVTTSSTTYVEGMGRSDVVKCDEGDYLTMQIFVQASNWKFYGDYCMLTFTFLAAD